MNRPTITINGAELEMPAAKLRLLMETVKLDSERQNLTTAEFVSRHCEIIARAFGVTTDEVIDNLEVSDLLPKFNELLAYLLAMFTAKLGDNAKNADDGI